MLPFHFQPFHFIIRYRSLSGQQSYKNNHIPVHCFTFLKSPLQLNFNLPEEIIYNSLLISVPGLKRTISILDHWSTCLKIFALSWSLRFLLFYDLQCPLKLLLSSCSSSLDHMFCPLFRIVSSSARRTWTTSIVILSFPHIYHTKVTKDDWLSEEWTKEGMNPLLWILSFNGTRGEKL